MKSFEGKLIAQNIRVGIVAARFNEFITSRLLGGAMDALLRHDVSEDDVHVAWVPGAFEIPLVASKMAKSGKYDAVICLGCSDSRLYQPLRLRLQRSLKRHRSSFAGKWYSCSIWRSDD